MEISSDDVNVFSDMNVDVGANETVSLQHVECDLPVKRKLTSQWCSAVNCSNERYSRPDLSFFRFPKDKERCRRKENIRQQFNTKLLNLPCSQRLKSPDCHCHTADYIASLFLTVRIHHELKLRNAAPKKRLHKQVPKLKKLLHC